MSRFRRLHLEKRQYFALVGFIVLLACLLRAPGLGWGMPNDLHPDWSYHHDEAFFVGWGNDISRGDVLPRHFIYGGAFFYNVLGIANRVAEWQREYAGMADRIFVARTFSLGFALLTLLVVAATGTLLYGRGAGVLAAGLLAIAPAHVIWAQRARPDELFTLLVATNLYLLARVVQSRAGDAVTIGLAGLCLGVVIATRFPAAVLGIAYVTAFCMQQGETGTLRGTVARCAVTGGFAVVGYSLASPQTWFYFSDFMSGLALQWEFQGGRFFEGMERGPGWWQYGGRIFAGAIGFGLYLPALGAIGAATWRRGANDVLLLAAIVPYFVLLSLTSWIVTRYFLPLLPAICLLTAAYALHLMRNGNRALRYGVAVLLVCGCSYNIAACVAYSGAITRLDARDEAALWLVKHAVQGAKIGVFHKYPGDVFDNPPALGRFKWSACVPGECDVDEFVSQDYDFIVISREVMGDVSRLRERHPEDQWVSLLHWYETQNDFRRAAVFEAPPRLRGFEFSADFDTHDFRIALPRIEVLKATAP